MVHMHIFEMSGSNYCKNNSNAHEYKGYITTQIKVSSQHKQ